MDHDEEPLQKVVFPLLVISRRLPDNTVNPREPNQQRAAMTSAGSKLSFAYDHLIDTFQDSITNPKVAFVLGFDYRIPVLHGLLDRNYIQKLKMSPSYNEASFATEYLSIWSGSSEESWYNYETIQRYRKIKNPEWAQKYVNNEKQFYLISVDVGRFNDQTVATVFRVNERKGNLLSTVVNIIVLGKDVQSKAFTAQAVDLKLIMREFNPREVIIDTNGLIH